MFRLLIKREILTSREVLYAKLNVLVISSCFAIKMQPRPKGAFSWPWSGKRALGTRLIKVLSKKGFFSLKMSA